MDPACLSRAFQVRHLTPCDTDAILSLMQGNHIFFRHHPPSPTRESIAEDMAALPPGKTYADKLYVGFFQGGFLLAVMDLILRHPDGKTAFIGFFMMHPVCQGRGTGSAIITECAAALRAQGFARIRLGVDKGNPQSNAFWRNNGFAVVDENLYFIMERAL